MSIQEAGAQILISDSWSITKSKVVKFSHVWKIENFSFYQKDKVIVSPPFGATETDETQWCLKVFPDGKSGEDKDHISIFLSLVSSRMAGVPAKYKISIMNTKQEAVRTMQNDEALKFKCGRGWGFGKFISRDSLLKNSEGSLPCDQLTVFCEVSTLAESMNISGWNSSGRPTAVQEVQSEGSDGSLGRKGTSDASLYTRSGWTDTLRSPVGTISKEDVLDGKQRSSLAREFETYAESAEQVISKLEKENHARNLELKKMVDQLKMNSFQSTDFVERTQDGPSSLPSNLSSGKLCGPLAEQFFGIAERTLPSDEKNDFRKVLKDLTAAMNAADEVIRRAVQTNSVNPTYSGNFIQAQTSRFDQVRSEFDFSHNRSRPGVVDDRFVAVEKYVPENTRSAPESLEEYATASMEAISGSIRSKSLDLTQAPDLNEIGPRDDAHHSAMRSGYASGQSLSTNESAEENSAGAAQITDRVQTIELGETQPIGISVFPQQARLRSPAVVEEQHPDDVQKPIKKFSGIKNTLEEWWRDFRAKVHDRRDLSMAQKYRYLISAVEGDAVRAIKQTGSDEDKYMGTIYNLFGM